MSLYDDLVTDLTAELQIADDKFNSTLLATKITNAIRQVKEKRNYPSTYTENQITADIAKYYTKIRAIALFEYAEVGAYGEKAHSEDGISRTYVSKSELFNGIYPISRIS